MKTITLFTRHLKGWTAVINGTAPADSIKAVTLSTTTGHGWKAVRGSGPPVVAPFSFPAKGARYHLDFAGNRFFGGLQPRDNTNANDGRFFRQIVSPSPPVYAENKDGSLVRVASGTPFKWSDRGLLVEPIVGYETRCLYNCDFTNAAWVKTGLTATRVANRSGVANTGSRLTATAANATASQATVFAASDLTGYVDLRPERVTGKVWASIDGVTFTEILFDAPRFNGWGRYKIPKQTVTDPTYVIRIENVGDIVDVALFNTDLLDFETSPIEVTTAVKRRPNDRPSTSIQGGTTTSVSSGMMDWLATATTWGVYMEWDSLKPDHFLFGQILRPFADGSVRFSTDDTEVRSVTSAPGLVRNGTDPMNRQINKALGWTSGGKMYVCVNGSQVFESAGSNGGPYTALDHKDLGSNGAGTVNMAGYIGELVIFDEEPSFAEAMLWTT